MLLASETTMGVYVDDPQGLSNIMDTFVDFYNGSARSTVSHGTEKVRSGLIVTSKFRFQIA